MNNILIYIILGLCCVILFVLLFTLIKDAFFSGRRTPDVKIIKCGKIPKEKAECPYCHSIIEYTKRNVWYGGKSIDGKMLRHYVDCPVCHENILVREEEGGEE